MSKPVARVIHVKHLFLYIIKKWYVLLLGMLLGSLCFSIIGVANIKQEQKDAATYPKEKTTKITISEAEYYNVLGVVEYEDMLAEKNKYIENSIRMQIDPFHRWDCSDVCTVEYIGEQNPVTGVGDIVKSYVEALSSQEFFEELSNQTEDKMEVGFFKEIITVTAVSEDKFSVSVCYYEKEELRKICDAIDRYLLENVNISGDSVDYRLNIEKGVPGETVDNGLMETQNGIRAEALATQDVVAYRVSLLSENALEYLKLYRDARYEADYVAGQPLVKTTIVEKKAPTLSLSTLKPDVKKGMIVGSVVAASILVCLYVFHPCLLNPDNLNDMLGLRILNDRKQIPVIAEKMNVTARKVDLNIPEEEKEHLKLLLTGSVLTDEKEERVQQFQSELEALGIHTLVSKSWKDYPDEIKKLKQADQVIFIERLGESRWENLIWQVSLCEESGKDMSGVLLI